MTVTAGWNGVKARLSIPKENNILKYLVMQGNELLWLQANRLHYSTQCRSGVSLIVLFSHPRCHSATLLSPSFYCLCVDLLPCCMFNFVQEKKKSLGEFWCKLVLDAWKVSIKSMLYKLWERVSTSKEIHHWEAQSVAYTHVTGYNKPVLLLQTPVLFP